MAETFTDSKGNVFPLNQFGRPQGFWDGNKFVFPQFGTAPAVSQPVVDPVSPVENVQPVQTPYRLPSTVREEQQGDAPTGGGSKANQFGGQNNATMQGGASLGNLNMSPQSGALLGSLAGRALGGPLGGIVGSGIGGYASGRGSRGIGGDIVGSLLGTALFGPVGGLLGILGGQIGDEADVRADRNSGMPSPDNTPQNFPISNDFRYDLSDLYPMVPPTFYPDTLSYRQGRNQRLWSGFQAPQRYSDNVYGDQSRVAEDKQLDAFSAIADAFGGDNPDDGSMDSSSKDNTFGYGIF